MVLDRLTWGLVGVESANLFITTNFCVFVKRLFFLGNWFTFWLYSSCIKDRYHAKELFAMNLFWDCLAIHNVSSVRVTALTLSWCVDKLLCMCLGAELKQLWFNRSKSFQSSGACISDFLIIVLNWEMSCKFDGFFIFFTGYSKVEVD